MKKIVIVSATGFATLLIISLIFLANTSQKNKHVPVIGFTSVTNGAYEVEGEQVQLANGVFSTPVTTGTARIVTRYFGNDAQGDINNDGKPDRTFLLARQGGGSGTFYYAVAAITVDEGYKGTNAVLLGDRISPQSTRIANGIIEVNYVDRKPGEPFTAKPTMGVTKYLVFQNNQLVEKK